VEEGNEELNGGYGKNGKRIWPVNMNWPKFFHGQLGWVKRKFLTWQ
jgi:hypothetical protein